MPIFDNSPDADGYVPLMVVSDLVGRQTQYVSYFIEGIAGRPALGRGLRFKIDDGNHHATRIHQDDVDEFVRRIKRPSN